MKSLPIAGCEWTVRLSRPVEIHRSPCHAWATATSRGWAVEQKAGEETHILKLTLAGDHEAVMAASVGLREAWAAQGWTVAHVGWKTRARLPQKETPPELPLAGAAEATEGDAAGDAFTAVGEQMRAEMALAPGSTGKDEGGEFTVNAAGEKVYDIPEKLRRKA